MSNPMLLQIRVFCNVLRRKSFFQITNRYKIVVGVAVCFLFAWMNIGSLKQNTTDHASIRNLPTFSSHQKSKFDPIQSKGKLKAKEYPDFDYKYDAPKRKVAQVDDQPLDEDTNFAPKVSVDDAKIKLLLPPEDDEHQIPSRDFMANRIPPVKSLKPVGKRRSNTINGIPIDKNLDYFDVVGSADLTKVESLDDGFDEFAADDAKVVPGLGENGEPVHLQGEEAGQASLIMAKEAFNLVASDKISLHRVVPDTRDPLCKEVTYDDDLPSASIIIIFTNEAWTPLLRTIWSVLNKTPDHLLKEIILVDDYSDKPYLKGKLDRYIRKKLPSKVRLKRLTKRSGLIRARLTGARLATGDNLLFLDSHCECGDDWYQPLAQRIKDEPNAFVVPIIDVIDDNTLEYYHGNGVYFQIGGFSWSGHFNWVDIPQHELIRRGSSISPTRTPTMAGGLFAVNRQTFWDFGSYDEEMDVWGGENLEMSFRVWQCGGVLETIPCSRVGHIFRSFHPYTFPGNKDTHGINTARTVEVWMDDFKRLFYMNRPDLLSTDIGDVSKRLEFKKQKQCKPFKWYLDNIFPQKFILDDPDHSFAYGRVRNPNNNHCLDTLQNDEKDTYDLGIYPCHDYVAASQFFSFSKKFEIRREDNCAEVAEIANDLGHLPIRMAPCHGKGQDQEWIHTKQGRLIHKLTNKCLDTGNGTADKLFATDCKAVQSQTFFYDNYIS